MPLEQLLLFILLALIAEILGTVGGFGSSMLFVPIAGYFLDFQSVLGITALFHVSSNISKIALFRKGFDKKLVLYLGLPAVVFVMIGAYVSTLFNPQYLELALAVFLILMSVFLLIKKTFKLQPNNRNAIVGGTISGFVAGLLGTGGAIRGLTLAAFSLKMEVFIATSAIIDLGVDLSRSGVYIFNGYVHKHDLYLIPILLIVSIVGTYLGKLILQKLPEGTFRTLVLVLIILTAVSVIVKFFI